MYLSICLLLRFFSLKEKNTYTKQRERARQGENVSELKKIKNTKFSKYMLIFVITLDFEVKKIQGVNCNNYHYFYGICYYYNWLKNSKKNL